MKSHKDLHIYQMALDLCDKIYNLTKQFPKNEIYGLTSQICRASVSVPSNIAEGAGRKTQKEFIQFLFIALGSLAEIETQLEIARRQGYVLDGYCKNVNNLVYSLRNKVKGLIKKIEIDLKNKSISM